MALNDVYRLTLRQRLHGQEVQNVLYFRFKGAGGTAATLRTTIAAAFANALAGNQSSELEHFSARTRGLIPYSDTVDTPYPAVIPGVDAGGSLPALCAAVSGLRTNQPGKSKRGRLYLSGVPVTAETDSQLLTAYVSALQADLDSLIATYGSGGTNPDYEWGVFSPTLGGTLITPPPPKQPYRSDPYNLAGFAAITTAIARSIVSSFVSRKYGRGI